MRAITARRLRAWLGLMTLALPALAAAQESRDPSWVDRRVQTWQPTKEERRFDDIAWVPDLRTALRLGKEHGRPVFLFTHDGRMNVGRC
jgi:hypothetical protein